MHIVVYLLSKTTAPSAPSNGPPRATNSSTSGVYGGAAQPKAVTDPPTAVTVTASCFLQPCKYRAGLCLCASNGLLGSQCALKEETEALLEQQKYVSVTIQVQKLIRGHLLRKRITALSKKERSRLTSRHQGLSTIIKQENNYVSRLRSIKTALLGPLEQSPPEGTVNSLRYLYSSTDRLLSVHEIFCSSLSSLENSPGYPLRVNAGVNLQENVGCMRVAYSAYAITGFDQVFLKG